MEYQKILNLLNEPTILNRDGKIENCKRSIQCKL